MDFITLPRHCVSVLTNVNVNVACNTLFCSEMSMTNSQIKSSIKEMKCRPQQLSKRVEWVNSNTLS